jgi:hypothetical protein
VLYLSNPPGVSRGVQKDVVDTVNALNAKFDATIGDPEIATRIAQYEMAFKMQASVPDLVDMSAEPQSVLDLYGCKPATDPLPQTACSPAPGGTRHPFHPTLS